LIQQLRREIARYRDAAPGLLTLGWQEWRALWKAQIALLRAQRELRRRPTGEFVRDGSVAPSALSAIHRGDDVQRLAIAMRRAARFGLFRPKCLVQSLALRLMLEDAGISGAIVRVGVQVVDGRFIAHAWVEYNGVVTGDDPEAVARYQPLSGIQVAEFR
jgi:hypothetical protein